MRWKITYRPNRKDIVQCWHTCSNKISRFLSKSDHASRYHPRRGLCNSCCTYYTLHQIWSRLENKNIGRELGSPSAFEKRDAPTGWRVRWNLRLRGTPAERILRVAGVKWLKDSGHASAGNTIGKRRPSLIVRFTNWHFRLPSSHKIIIVKNRDWKGRKRNPFSEGGGTATLRNVLTILDTSLVLLVCTCWFHRDRWLSLSKYCAPYTAILYIYTRHDRTSRVTGVSLVVVIFLPLPPFFSPFRHFLVALLFSR